MKQSMFPYAAENTWGLKDGHVICKPDLDWYGEVDFGGNLCQYGRCTECGVLTVSEAKHAICAMCGNTVYGT